ncbi:MAG: DNA translocase FtsK [Gammaproteobacteria bacterium]
MAQAVRKRASPSIGLNGHIVRHLKEGALLALCAVACFVFVAFLTYHPADPAWTHTGSHAGAIANKAGVAGAWLADIALHLFGYVAYLFPIALCFSAWLLFKGLQSEDGPDYLYGMTRLVGFLLTVTLGSGLVWAHLDWGDALPYRGAGIVGGLIGREVGAVFGHLGGTMLMLAMFLTGVTLFTGLSWFRVMDITGRWVLRGIGVVRYVLASIIDRLHGRRVRRERAQVFEVETSKIAERPKPRIEVPPLRAERSVSFGREQQVSLFEPPDAVQPPPLSLLDLPPPPRAGFSTTTLEAMSRQVELKLQDFGIDVAVVAVHPGPVITRFELQPAPGVKASRITSLNKDLARSLSTISVRVVEVIPGKTVIGLEIPNHQRELVALRDILGAPEYEANPSPLTLALGKDIGGKPVAVDLARMPHLLVAGTTGAGKSVALNAMILSMLYKAMLRDVRLIMIDPKMLELSVYDGIPSLLAPVVTDMKEAANALRWCVAEMERRYKLMAALGVRNLAGYNRRVRDAETAGEPLRDPFGSPGPVAETGWAGEVEVEVALLCTLPYIVVIVDELADMMMTVGKKVEELIARLAQKARAAGIHLILATQRPSVDVITGLIKANIPSRIAFQVSSRVDSRTILDQMGAENLLGHGDMLYLPPGTGMPVRVHGAFVSDQEVHKVVAYLKSRGAPEYVEAIVSGEDETDAEDPVAETESGGEADALYDEAVRFVTETRRASVSGVQRRLKIGYNRAARMVEEMERQGVVGSLQSNGFREVLVRPPPAD